MPAGTMLPHAPPTWVVDTSAPASGNTLVDGNVLGTNVGDDSAKVHETVQHYDQP